MTNVTRLGRALAAVGVIAGALTISGMTAPAFGQEDVERGHRVFRDKGECDFCHGWSGNGRGEERSGGGANLRETTLDAEALAETIRCGRPGTNMPAHDRMAYVNDSCYGLTAADLGRDKPPAGAPLNFREIDAVVAYLMAKVIGRGEPTREECIEYFGSDNARCQQMQ